MSGIRENVLGALDYLLNSDPKHADIIRAAIKQITDDEYRIRELIARNEQTRAETVREFTEKIKRYYTAVRGGTYPALVAYHVDKVGKEMLEGVQEDAD